MTRQKYRFRILQSVRGDWTVCNEWTGECIYGYETRYRAVQARERLENGPVFYDEGELKDFIAAEVAAGRTEGKI